MARQVATIIGCDRPGILDDVCTVVERNSGRVVDIRSTDCAGQFAMLALYESAESAQPAIALQLGELASVSSMHLSISEAIDGEAKPINLYRLVAAGGDHVGVLRQLSHLLRVLSINVDQIDTRRETADRTAITLLLEVPRDCPLTKLREFVGQLLSAHKMEWELKTV